jgi:hypothetical protein
MLMRQERIEVQALFPIQKSDPEDLPIQKILAQAVIQLRSAGPLFTCVVS